MFPYEINMYDAQDQTYHCGNQSGFNSQYFNSYQPSGYNHNQFFEYDQYPNTPQDYSHTYQQPNCGCVSEQFQG